jgi:hypothetical protein
MRQRTVAGPEASHCLIQSVHQWPKLNIAAFMILIAGLGKISWQLSGLVQESFEFPVVFGHLVENLFPFVLFDAKLKSVPKVLCKVTI